jgi:hypothetical protein
MPFDPDKYLAEKTQSFDPDQYLAEKLGAVPAQEASQPDMEAANQQIQRQMNQRGQVRSGPEVQFPGHNIAGNIGTGLTSGIIPPPEGSSPGEAFAGQAIGGTLQALALPEKKIFDAGSGAIQGFTATEGTIPQKLVGAAIGGVLGLGLGIAGRAAGKLLTTL